MPTPSLYPPLTNVLASQSGGGSGTIVAAGVGVALGADAVAISPSDETISVAVFPNSIIAGS